MIAIDQTEIENISLSKAPYIPSNFDFLQEKRFDQVARLSQHTFCMKLWISASKRSRLTKEDRQTSVPLQNKTIKQLSKRNLTNKLVLN